MIKIQNKNTKPGVTLMPNHFKFQSEEVRMFQATEVISITDEDTGVVTQVNSVGRTIKYGMPRSTRRMVALEQRKLKRKELCNAN
jgi:hypothetical protein